MLEIDAIVFDFDGVLTDNRVYVDQDGRESVCCSRADGLAFDVLRQSRYRVFLLSTEANPVVAARAAKLRVPCVQGVADKRAAIAALGDREGFALERTLFVGNDLNDLAAMKLCGVSACPADSHAAVLAAATHRLKTRGGAGVAREIVEDVLGLNMLSYFG